MSGFDQRLRGHIRARCADLKVPLSRGLFYPNRSGGLLEPAKAALDALDESLIHHFIGHICSSQAFALNLFAGLDEAGRQAIFQQVGVEVVDTDPAVFEFCADDRLGERTVLSPHSTQIDVLLRGHSDDGSLHLLLVEVKLTERDFSTCSGYESASNGSRDVCVSNGAFGGDPQACFQLRNHDRGQRRTYDVFLGVLGAPNGDVGCAGCWLRLGNNQVMRQVALARALSEEGQPPPVVALCAPVANRTIWRRWSEAKAALGSVQGVRLADLPADAACRSLPAQYGQEIAERYLLGATVP